MATAAPPRRFKVEPVETTVRSSKDRVPDEGSSPRPRKFVPELVEKSTKTNRRFVPEPISTSVKSSRDRVNGETDSRRPRKFAPEPIELSPRSSRKKFAEEWNSEITDQKKQRSPRQPRKFAPQLVETARRTRKAGDSAPNLGPADKTEATPKALQTSGLGVPSPPSNTPTFDYSQNPLFAEIQRATSPLTRRRPVKRLSHHCFRVPDLDAIESSESEGSTPSSPAASSYFPPQSHSYKEPTRIRESVDEKSSGYLLELAAKAAEKQLREQAMAAFPNDDHHEPVDHFVDREDSLVDEAITRRDSSHHEVNWEVIAMRQHRERAEQQEEREQKLERGREAATSPNDQTEDPSNNTAALVNSANKENVGGYQKDDELDRMRKDARPPMLGQDIRFPRCHSPEPARFDTTQGCDVVKKAMCYLTEQSHQAEKGGESLWCGKGNGKQSSQADPFSPFPTPSTTLLPPTPPASYADFACIDEKLAVERTIDEEFGDNFVTQVYNYLSLGYPSMAQPFDAELSKISNISTVELRQDDHLAETRGYIRLGADGNLTDEEITEESCMRWRALRIYIREWAKQKPGMANDNPAGGHGTAVRRGSWGI
ncbi:hypothetical protein P280DRAFT_410197 [Massarina eburnea CBS 473.64]|uniref:Uncharacterized protein n=1 Tax=Massarina eburnea CBS 473.64 TaxID=1395130 RepID=A0A6A6RNE2_9PLEO|nr:hypothetical protein P280DRAFT_410197 [Massarina eburnea CBS 473.64]